MCDISLFQSTIQRLDDTWQNTVVSVLPNIPKKSGLSFGSCYVICGSIGISNVDNLILFDLQLNESVVSFTQCGLKDYAILQVPIETQPYVNLTMELRATGLGLTWPNEPDFDAFARLTGVLLISVPIRNKTLEFVDVEVDMIVYGSWYNVAGVPLNDPWPEQDSFLFNSVPLDILLKQYVESLTKYFKAELVPKVRDIIQAPNVSINCIVPANVSQTCTALTTFPSSACNPCDTCCKCLVQQRCDGECKDCPCVSCKEVKTWSFTQLIVTFIVVCFIISWVFFVESK